MKTSFSNQIKSVLSFLLLIILGGICLSASECNKAPKKTGEIEKTLIKTTMENEQIVSIRNTYTMEVPSDFNVEEGTGDDTNFLNINNPKQDLKLWYETGPGTREESGTYKDIQSFYSNIAKVEAQNDLILYIAYKEIDASFRNIEGKVFIEEDGELQEILRLSSSTGQMSLLESIIKTLKSKN